MDREVLQAFVIADDTPTLSIPDLTLSCGAVMVLTPSAGYFFATENTTRSFKYTEDVMATNLSWEE